MADPVWGMLQKALDDAQTIAENIAAAITAHEADPDAHTGTGESLETHKSQDTIDHPAGSILVDKLTYTEFLAQSNFESIDAWTKVGDVDFNGWTGARLYIETGATVISKLYSVIDWYGDFIDFTKDMLFQTTLWQDAVTQRKAFFMLGFYNSETNWDGFGFTIVNGTVKGFWKNSTGIVETADLSITSTDVHVYRAQYNATDKSIKFFVDGILKATITDTSIGSTSFEGNVAYIYKTNGTADGYLRIKNIMIGRQA